MGYQKQNFVDCQVLNSAQLNHIEDGIVDLEGNSSTALAGKADKTEVQAIAKSVSDETTRAKGEEQRLDTAITAEKTRAEQAEQALDTRTAALESCGFVVVDGKVYDCPWDVVKTDDIAEGETGTTAPAMVLQMHYASLEDIQFSAYQAFYVVPEAGLVAGTYNIIFDFTYGTNVINGGAYNFTLTKNAPAGARMTGFYNAPDVAPANWKVYVYKDQYKSELLETCNVSSGVDGINLGSFLAKPNGKLNGLHSVAYGDNRWYKSAYRQYLNSDAPAKEWWAPQDEWDMKPDQADTVPGFLAGFSDDFKAALTRVKVVTYGNAVTDDGSAVVTYDKVFLPSLQEIYCSPLVSGEGTYWPYWKERTGAKTPQTLWQTYPLRITRDLAQRTVGRNVRLRSAHRGNGNYAFGVNSSGSVYDWTAVDAIRCAPACEMTNLK